MYTHELNFIWVGDKLMPGEQRNNLHVIHSRYPTAKINLWVMPNLLHPKMQKFIETTSFITQQDIEQLNLDFDTSPRSFALIEKLKSSSFWACLSDMLRLLVLTRELETDAPSKRFYMEADNNYKLDLETIINSRGIVVHAESGYYIRPDSFFIDVASEDGLFFKRGLKTHLERLLSDDLVNDLLHELTDQKTLHFADVVNSFGQICYILIKLVMHTKPDFIKSNSTTDFCEHGKYVPWSWRDNNAQLHKGGLISMLICARFIENLVDINNHSRQGIGNINHKTVNTSHLGSAPIFHLYLVHMLQNQKTWTQALTPTMDSQQQLRYKVRWFAQ